MACDSALVRGGHSAGPAAGGGLHLPAALHGAGCRLGGGGTTGALGQLQFADFFAGFSPSPDAADAGGSWCLALFMMILMICAFMLHLWG